MEKFQHIVGADLSKKTIDLHCYRTGGHLRITNSASGFREMLKWSGKQGMDLSGTMVVMEHTGLYSFCFEAFLHGSGMAFTKVSALAIKNSLGLVRGKSDRVDAARIARYGFEKQAVLEPDTQVDGDLQRLQVLHSTRELLVRQRAALLNSLKEYANIGLPRQDPIMLSQERLVRQFGKEIEKIDAEMDRVIEGNATLRGNFNLLVTIKGVGRVIAIATLVRTRNFTRFTDARKFACHCGTAPFEHTSGTSIRGRTRVSHMADKRMKTLLDLSAKSAIQYDKELREYYLKRVAMGKSKMSTINIVRNKILYRMFAVVKRQTPFVDNYLQAA